MKRLMALARWIGFVLIVLPLFPHNGEGQQRPAPLHEMRGPGDSAVLHLTEYTAPPIYAEWWAEIAECEGFPIPTAEQQASVQWFSVPAIYFAPDGIPLEDDGGALAGTFDREPAIYIGHPYIWEWPIIEHEMMHMVLHWAGFELGNYHPPEIFTVCGLSIAYPAHP